MIRILIVDDSSTDTLLLKSIFDSQSDMSVVGCARNGLEALTMAENLKPDLITMDVEMPHMSGYEATKLIMTKFAIPVVIISSNVTDHEAVATFKALESGALTVLAKPSNIMAKEFAVISSYMLDTIRSMSEIKVIKKSIFSFTKKPAFVISGISKVYQKNYKLIVIGSSVGGPQALKAILSKLPRNFPVPIVVVQHMTKGFINGFAKWLADHVSLQVKCAEEGEKLQAGIVYFAPDDKHLVLQKRDNTYLAGFVKDAPVSGFCPSISVMMKSAASSCKDDVIGVLLTGMGVDGADGLLALKNKGAHTLVQDEESCVVFGMGNVAKSFGAVDKEMELDHIGEYLLALTAKHLK